MTRRGEREAAQQQAPDPITPPGVEADTSSPPVNEEKEEVVEEAVKEAAAEWKCTSHSTFSQ